MSKAEQLANGAFRHSPVRGLGEPDLCQREPLPRSLRLAVPAIGDSLRHQGQQQPRRSPPFTLAGAGGDAFGPGELYLTLLAGTDPNLVVLNGFNKRDEEIRMAVEAGVTVHLDTPDELDDVIRIAREVGRRARIGMRSRLLLHGLDDVESEFPSGVFVGPAAREINKFGIDLAGMEHICERAMREPDVKFVGFHHHVGRGAADVRLHREVVREQLEVAARLRDQFG